MINESKKCWKQFLTPTVREAQDDIEILDFICNTAHWAFSVYYSKSDGISVDTFSKAMNSALSSCFHCIQSKLDCHSLRNKIADEEVVLK